MMKKLICCLVSITIMLLHSCGQPVRKSYLQTLTHEEELLKTKGVRESSVRFRDTLYFQLVNSSTKSESPEVVKMDAPAPEIKPPTEGIQTILESGLTLFNKGKFNQAKEKFEEIIRNSSVIDSARWESRFMSSECDIQLAEFANARTSLLKLYLNNPPAQIKEKTLVRLGQVCCAMNKIEEAKKHFANFAKEFPNSEYQTIANCESIR